MLTIVQNDPEVPLGTYGERLAAHGIPYLLCRPFAGESFPPDAKITALLVLGGAMGVHDTAIHPFLQEVKQLIRRTIDHSIPFLGICLGGQLLADVLGAPVASRSPHGEKGMVAVDLTPVGRADPLFVGIPSPFVTFQWHDDSFAIPAGGVLLASSATCPNQVFRWGKNAYGLQFHPEVDRVIVANWSRWTNATSGYAERFGAEFAAQLPAYQAASWRLLDNFLELAGISSGFQA